MAHLGVTAAELATVLAFKATFNAALYDAPFGTRMTLYLSKITDQPLIEVNAPMTGTASLIKRTLGLIDEAPTHLI